MLLFAIFFGCGNGLFIGIGNNYIYTLAPAHLRATAQGIYVSVSQFSGILGSLIGGIFFELVGGKQFYRMVAYVFVLAIVIFAVSYMFINGNEKRTERFRFISFKRFYHV